MIDGRIHFAGNPGPEDRADDTGPFDAEWTGATALPHIDGYTRDHRFETVIRPAPFPELPHAACAS